VKKIIFFLLLLFSVSANAGAWNTNVYGHCTQTFSAYQDALSCSGTYLSGYVGGGGTTVICTYGSSLMSCTNGTWNNTFTLINSAPPPTCVAPQILNADSTACVDSALSSLVNFHVVSGVSGLIENGITDGQAVNIGSLINTQIVTQDLMILVLFIVLFIWGYKSGVELVSRGQDAI